MDGPNDRVTIGFDSRVIDDLTKETGAGAARHWGGSVTSSRGGCLLSIDPETWPRIEVEQLQAAKKFEISYRNGLGLFVEPLPIDFRQSLEKHFMQIAIDISESSISYLGNMFGQLRSKSEPTVDCLRRKGWKIVGFDVVDIRTLVSGVSGFELSVQDRENLFLSFGNEINLVGLFMDYRAANTYSEKSNEMFPEHAPFSPVGIWLEPGYESISPQLAAITAHTGDR